MTHAAAQPPPRRARAAVAFALAAIAAAQPFLFVPLTLYRGNHAEFVTPFGTLLAHYALPAAALVAAATGAGVALRPADFPRYAALLATLGLLLWAQGNLFVWDYGALDGRPIDWTRDRWRGVVDLAVWGSALVLAVRAAPRAGRALIATALALFAVQLGAAGLAVAARGGDLAGPAGGAHAALRDLARFSPDRNVLHVVADGFQADVFAEIVGDGAEGRAFRDALDGFVFFERHLGAFPYTHMSVPALLGGRMYRNEMPREAFLDATLGATSVLGAARDAGYDVEIATDTLLAGLYRRAPHDAAYLIPAGGHLGPADAAGQESARLLDLALFRVVPHFLKRLVYDDQRWLIQPLFGAGDQDALPFFAHRAFLERLAERVAADRERPAYKLLHLMLVHNPFVANAACGYVGRVLPAERPHVTAQARCSLRALVALLDALRRAGVYDRTTIVVMGDHGAWVRPAGMPGGDVRRVRPDGRVENLDSITAAMATPLLAIKPAGAHGPLLVSAAPSWIVDVPATIAALERFPTRPPGTSAFELAPDAPRQRRFHSYAFAGSEWSAEYLAPITEFVVDGTPTDSAAWRVGRRFLPGGVVEAAPGATAAAPRDPRPALDESPRQPPRSP